MKKSLIIADNDHIFVKSLEDYLFINHGDEFEIRTISSKEYLEKYFSTPRKVDILLLNPKFEFDKMKDQYINNILFISDNEEDSIRGYDSIFRFGELNFICNKLRNIDSRSDEEFDYTKEININKVGTRTSKVITVYSPIGGVGKTTIAVSIAVDLALKGSNVLYLNLEDIASTHAYFEHKKTDINLSHIIDQLTFGGIALSQYINKSIVLDSKTNISYINPADNIFAIDQMSADDVKYFISILKELKKFDYIVIDTSSTYNTLKKAIIDSSDNIIMPMEQSEICKQKVLNILNFIDEEELHKFTPILNKYRQEISNNINEVTSKYSRFHIQGIINFYEPLQDSELYINIFNKHNPFTSAIKSIINY